MRRAHPLFCFSNGLVGEADDREGRQTGRDLHLHVYRAGLDALERHRGYALDHASPLGCETKSGHNLAQEQSKNGKSPIGARSARNISPCENYDG
jgi:hypothetical protein